MIFSSLKNWEISDQNCKRVTLNPSSEEYQDVLTRFHETMLVKYNRIINIERIQNERWYKQVIIIHIQILHIRFAF